MITGIKALQVLLICVSISVLGSASAQPGAPVSGPYSGASPYYSAPGPSPFSAPPALYPGNSPSGSGAVSPYSRFGSIPSPGAYRVPPPPGASVSGPTRTSGRPTSPADLGDIRSAYRHGDFEGVSREADTVEQRTRDLKQISPDLPVQERLKVPLLNYQAKQGINYIESGRDSRNEYKVGVGVEQINDVNQRVKNLERMGNRGESEMAPRSGRGQSDQRDRGQGQNQGRGQSNDGGRRKGR